MGRAPIKKTRNPAVIVDLLFEELQLFILVQNNSDQPLYRVSVKFDKPIIGWDGKTDIAALRVFQKIETLAPRKTIPVFVDRIHGYFARKQPNVISAQISYEDASGQVFNSALKHNVAIYKELTDVTLPGRT